MEESGRLSDIQEEEEYASLLKAAKRDRIYTTTAARAFAFGEEVAEVFDDMISRSVPYYLDLQLLTASVAVKFHREGTAIYDLGCSTGTAIALIAKRLPKLFDIYGIDSSSAMLKQAEQKLTSLNVRGQVIFKNERLQEVSFRESSVIVSNYTFQFLPLVDRGMMLRRVYDALVEGGAFLYTEKTVPYQLGPHKDLVKELHEDFKYQNGYSELEIARKRESLQGVMQPIGERKNKSLLREAGFAQQIELMRGYSFVTWLCIKE